MSPFGDVVWRAFLALVMLFMVTPLLLVVLFSFGESALAAFPLGTLSFKWYEILFARGEFWNSFRHSLQIAVSVGIISTIVFTFTLTLHEFIYGLVFISNTSQRTLSVGVPTELILGDVYFWQPLLAAALIIAIPVGLAYNLFLDSLVQGFTMGAVKG